MTISLDSNVLIDVLNGFEPVRGRYNAGRAGPDPLRISALVYEELRFGAEISGKVVRETALLDDILVGVIIEPFNASDSAAAARARGLLEKKGKRIGQVDALIAGHALSRGWTLVTANTRHFDRIEGLSLLDWRAPRPPG